jgi:glycyl-tRNA synthetase
MHIATLLTQNGISHRVDTSSNAIGRRYARSDEIAIPFAIAIDFDTLKPPHSIVLRELDSLKQIRVNVIIFSHNSSISVRLSSSLYLD